MANKIVHSLTFKHQHSSKYSYTYNTNYAHHLTFDSMRSKAIRYNPHGKGKMTTKTKNWYLVQREHERRVEFGNIIFSTIGGWNLPTRERHLWLNLICFVGCKGCIEYMWELGDANDRQAIQKRTHIFVIHKRELSRYNYIVIFKAFQWEIRANLRKSRLKWQKWKFG